MAHGDDVKYTVYVLWLKGYTEREIGLGMMLRRKQVAGIVSRSEYANRSDMSTAERQHKLNELRDIRIGEDGRSIDRGRLDKFEWVVKPIYGQQKKG